VATGADWLDVAGPHLPPSLIGAPALRRLRDLARRLPGTSLLALEARLAPERSAGSPVDLSVRLQRPAEALAVARALDGSQPLHLRGLLESWARARWRPARVPELWLEFDLDGEPPASSLPVPIVCARLAAGAGPAFLLDSLLPRMLGRSPPEGQRRLLARCLEAIRPPALPLYLFALLSRRRDEVRLEIAGLDLAAAGACLEAVGVPGRRRLDDLEPLFGGVERLLLSVDVGPRAVAPRFGLGGSYRRLPAREPRWAALLDRLVAAGLGCRRKSRAVLAWTGYDTPATAGDRWPWRRSPGREFVARALSHLKVVVRPSAPFEAKVYLFVQHLHRRPRRGAEPGGPRTQAAGAPSPSSRSRASTRSR